MKIEQLHVTQRKLRNVEQIPLMLKAIADDDVLPPVRLAEFEDGSIHIEDGHHRCTAYWLSGREELEDHEYQLIQKDFQDKNRFGTIADLFERICDGEQRQQARRSKNSNQRLETIKVVEENAGSKEERR